MKFAYQKSGHVPPTKPVHTCWDRKARSLVVACMVFAMHCGHSAKMGQVLAAISHAENIPAVYIVRELKNLTNDEKTEVGRLLQEQLQVSLKIDGAIPDQPTYRNLLVLKALNFSPAAPTLVALIRDETRTSRLLKLESLRLISQMKVQDALPIFRKYMEGPDLLVAYRAASYCLKLFEDSSCIKPAEQLIARNGSMKKENRKLLAEIRRLRSR